MRLEQIHQSLDNIEQCADEALRAVKAGSVPAELRQSVETLHQHASQAKGNPLMDDVLLRETVLQLEQMADQAMQACRNAGGGLDPQVLHAVQDAHGEIVTIKREVLALT